MRASDRPQPNGVRMPVLANESAWPGCASVLRVDHISYQLLHRTAAALIEAERFNANTAVTLIHSFSGDRVGFKDYQAFISLFGKWSKPNTVTNVGRRNGVQLYTS
jgi:hypothetical protein